MLPLINSGTPGSTDWVAFYSKERSDTSLRPILNITYTIPSNSNIDIWDETAADAVDDAIEMGVEIKLIGWRYSIGSEKNSKIGYSYFFKKLLADPAWKKSVKIFEYMAMAKPVVANEEIFEHKEVLEQSGGGLLVAYAKEQFAEAILKLLNNTKMARQMGKMGRYWVNNNRTYEILARNLEKRCSNLFSSERKPK